METSKERLELAGGMELETDWDKVAAERAHQEWNEAKEAEIEARFEVGFSANYLFNTPVDAVTYYATNIALAGGMTLLCGEPKAGKSLFTYHGLATMGRKGLFLGEQCSQVNALYASELSKRILEGPGQLKEVPLLNGNHSLNFIPIEQNGHITKDVDAFGEPVPYIKPFGSWEEQINFWVTTMMKRNAKILVIDTLMTFVPFQEGMANDSTQVAQYLAKLKARVLGYNKDASIVILHHLRKGLTGAAKSFNDILGSVGFRASADMNVLLTRPFGPEDTRRKIAVEGRLEGERSMTIDLTANGYVIVPEAEVKESEEEIGMDQKLIASYVERHPEAIQLSIRKLAAATGVKDNQARIFKERFCAARTAE